MVTQKYLRQWRNVWGCRSELSQQKGENIGDNGERFLLKQVKNIVDNVKTLTTMNDYLQI